MPATTANTYKAYSGSTVADATITALIDYAQAVCEAYCGFAFDESLRLEDYNGTGTDTLILSGVPISSVSQVAFVTGQTTTSIVPSSAYRYTAATGELHACEGVGGWYTETAGILPRHRIGPVWPRGVRNIRVTYTAGWSNDHPSGIVYAVNRVVDYMLAARGSDPRIQSEAMGSYNYTLAGANDALMSSSDVQAVLNQWRRGL